MTTAVNATLAGNRPLFTMTPLGALIGNLGAGGKNLFSGDAVIEALFAASEVGAWYDPSDLSTMFQDSAGTIPVTADGQPVGLILDKSKGLVLGSELITNGDFSAGGTDWTVAGNVTIGGNVAAYVGAGVKECYQSILTSGKFYKLTLVITRFVSAWAIRARLGSSDIDPGVTGIGTYTIYGYGDGTNASVIDYGASDFDISSISVKELPGNHAIQATAASRPLKTSTGAADWTNYDAVDDVLNTIFPSSLGSSCTVCRANVGAAPTILTAQTIGTSYADSTDNAGLIIINRALTGQETTDVTAWLLAKGATA